MALVPSGSAGSCRGSNRATSAPAPRSSSTVSAYPKLKAAPPATATTGRVVTDGPDGDHGGGENGGADRATASTASRLTDAVTTSASAFTASTASDRRSTAGTSPRCRDGAA